MVPFASLNLGRYAKEKAKRLVNTISKVKDTALGKKRVVDGKNQVRQYF